MRKCISIIIFLLASGSLFAATIVLDTGHTVAQPGAISPGGKTEHDYNRQLIAALKPLLVAQGYKVIDVAASGMDTSLAARTVATSAAELFISIHHDSMPQEWISAGRAREYSGFALFVSEKNPFPEKSLRCAQSVGAALIAAGEHPSLYHATLVKGENRPLLDRQLGVHQFDDLVVLRTAQSPAILLEVGVIANPDEEQRLALPAFAQRMAAAIQRGIRACVD